ncbi:hypothetical protein FZC84_12025 [Rossellomorea vietnamensis]|uniref:Uncharacterized protein n=1 Tax=Rossellomorea vietnamensis TaxID=218284 RepID=A0A5D4MBT4_9BACI|nr:hypothetical protein [Rossellomorea vietnamensis]TYR99096.1 hypothetical protein FZC84_12025 [Rossellomorea vietnamensis]
MGILYEKVQISQEAQKKIMAQQLRDLGVLETKAGVKVDDLNYYEVRHELTLAEIRKTDIESPGNKWF